MNGLGSSLENLLKALKARPLERQATEGLVGNARQR